MQECKDCLVDVTLMFYAGGEEKGGKYLEKENIFFWRRRNIEKEKDENIWRRSLQKLSRILRSLSFRLGLETFANFWRGSISVSENLASEKKSRFWKIWSQKRNKPKNWSKKMR